MSLQKRIEKVIEKENPLFGQIFNYFYNQTVPSINEIEEAVKAFTKLNNIPFRNENEGKS